MNFYSRKMPYQCIEHMGNKLSPTEKLQMYCDIASHFECIDINKLRLVLGIMFTQRNCVEGHYIGEISKENFEKMIDECLQHAHKVQSCQELPALYGIDIELNECYLCPYSTHYINRYADDEIKILRYIYNSDDSTGSVMPAIPYLNFMNSSKIELNSLIEIKADDSPDNGVCAPLASILHASASSWLGIDRLDWFIENVLMLQLRNKKVAPLYPSASISRFMTEHEILKCVSLFKQEILEHNEYHDINSFKELVSNVKKKQHKEYIPIFDDCGSKQPRKNMKCPNKTKPAKKELPSAQDEAVIDYSTFFLGEAATADEIEHIPYSPIPTSLQAEQTPQITATKNDEGSINNTPNEEGMNIEPAPGSDFVSSKPSVTIETDAGSDDNGSPSPDTSAMNAGPASSGSIASYMHRIEDPLECINIKCRKDYFPIDELVIINTNSHIEELTVFKEIASRQFIVCDAVTMEDTHGFLLYLDPNSERNFEGKFYFFNRTMMYDKLLSILKNNEILKLTLSPFALQSMLAENCMCQNVISLSDIYVLYKENPPTLKKLGDGKGNDDHLVRVYKHMYSMCEQFLANPKIKTISSYHSAIAMSYNINDYVSNSTIDYDGCAIHYNYTNDHSHTLIPGVIFSISNIELDMHCEVGIPEITKNIIAKLYNGRYIYDENIKILSETSDGLTIYIPSNKDAYSVIDIINRITVKTIRELTNYKPTYTISIQS